MNQEEIRHAKDLMEQGWKAREALDFEKADELLKMAMQLFEKNEDWFNVTECLNHLAYTEKVKAVHGFEAGIKLAEKSLKISEEKGTKKVLLLRALASLSAAVGNFEVAMKYAKESVELMQKPEDKADMNVHIAFYLLRTGKPDEALELINDAILVLEKNESEVRDPHISIWLTNAMVKKGCILYDLGRLDEAKKIGEEALKIEKEKDTKTRGVETEEFLKLFK